MKVSKTNFLAAALLAGSMTPAFAEGLDMDIPGDFSANVSISNNYIYRGITQTDDGMAISGGFDYSNGIFYAGTWASSVDFDSTTSAEIDFYGGVAKDFNGFTVDVGVLYYAYPDDAADQNFVEIYGGVSTTVAEMVDVGVKASFSPDFYASTGDAWYTEVSADVPVTDMFSVGGHLGWNTFKESAMDDYMDWNIGLTTSLEGFDIDLRFYDVAKLTGASDGEFVIAVSRSF